MAAGLPGIAPAICAVAPCCSSKVIACMLITPTWRALHSQAGGVGELQNALQPCVPSAAQVASPQHKLVVFLQQGQLVKRQSVLESLHPESAHNAMHDVVMSCHIMTLSHVTCQQQLTQCKLSNGSLTAAPPRVAVSMRNFANGSTGHERGHTRCS